MPRFMIVLIFFKPFFDNKMSCLRTMEPLTGKSSGILLSAFSMHCLIDFAVCQLRISSPATKWRRAEEVLPSVIRPSHFIAHCSCLCNFYSFQSNDLKIAP